MSDKPDPAEVRDKNWLIEQFASAKKEIASWPKWVRDAVRFNIGSSKPSAEE